MTPADSPPAEPTPAWEALPAEGVFPLALADTRAALSRVVVRPGEGTTRIDAGIGADFPFVQWSPGRVRAQVGLTAAVFMDFDAGGALTFDLETFDGTFALPIDVAAGPWAARAEFSHTSAHWGDGVRKGDERPTNLDAYSREALSLAGSYDLWFLRAYAGAHVLVHRYPEVDPWGVQLGVEARGPWNVSPYLAVDMKLAGEFAWEPEVAGQAGLLVGRPGRRLRVAVAAHAGPDDTGKREGAPEPYVGLLFGFDATGALATLAHGAASAGADRTR